MMSLLFEALGRQLTTTDYNPDPSRPILQVSAQRGFSRLDSTGYSENVLLITSFLVNAKNFLPGIGRKKIRASAISRPPSRNGRFGKNPLGISDSVAFHDSLHY